MRPYWDKTYNYQNSSKNNRFGEIAIFRSKERDKTIEFWNIILDVYVAISASSEARVWQLVLNTTIVSGIGDCGVSLVATCLTLTNN